MSAQRGRRMDTAIAASRHEAASTQVSGSVMF